MDDFERDVLTHLADAVSHLRDALRAQAAVAQVARRERARDGLLVYLTVPPDTPLAVPPDLDLGADARVVGVSGNVYVAVSVRDGRLATLQASMIGASWPARPDLVGWVAPAE